MKNKQDTLAKIQSELQDSPEKRDAIISMWEEMDEQKTVNDNQQQPKPHSSDEAGPARGPGMPFIGLPYYYGYDNYVIQSRNTCGQAVIGSFVDFYNKNPFGLNRTVQSPDGRMHYENMEFIGKIFHEYGPNFPMPNGVTVRETIMTACTKYGLKYNEYYPGSFSDGKDSQAELTGWLQKYRKPVAVLVDTGTNIFNNPQPYTLHWCTVYAYDANGVHIATWGRSEYVDWKTFMDAWHCWWLPYPNNYYQLRVWDI